MRKIFLIASILVTLSGCAYYHDRMAAAKACLEDPACKAQVENQKSYWKAVAEGTGFPFAGAAAGGLVTALALFFARKKEPK